MSIEFFILLSAIQAENIVTPTKRLLDDLLTKSYITDIRPTDADENVTVVKIIPNMFILLEMDQQQETIRFSEEFMLSWKDPIYTWNPADYPDYNQDWIKLPENKLWSPGVVFQPSIAKEEFIPIEKRFVDLKYDGTVRQSNPSVITTPCTLKIDAFPYDVQICDLLIGPWSYDISTVIVEPFDELYVPETDVFEGNSEWELIDIRAKAYTTFDPISRKNYSGIDYQVTLKRKPIYYVLVIQVTLGINMFVSISMMLNLVADMMPKASRLPLLGNYILAEIFVCGSAVVVSLIIHTIHEKAHSRLFIPPNWFMRIMLCDCKRKEINPLPHELTQHPQATPDIVPFTILQDSIQKTCYAVRFAIFRMRKEGQIRLQWILLFDRLDFYLLLLFQALNILVSALFMR